MMKFIYDFLMLVWCILRAAWFVSAPTMFRGTALSSVVVAVINRHDLVPMGFWILVALLAYIAAEVTEINRGRES